MGMGGVSNIFEQRDSGLLHFLAQGLNMLFLLLVLQLSHHSSFCPKIDKDFFFRQSFVEGLTFEFSKSLPWPQCDLLQNHCCTCLFSQLIGNSDFLCTLEIQYPLYYSQKILFVSIVYFSHFGKLYNSVSHDFVCKICNYKLVNEKQLLSVQTS